MLKSRGAWGKTVRSGERRAETPRPLGLAVPACDEPHAARRGLHVHSEAVHVPVNVNVYVNEKCVISERQRGISSEEKLKPES